MKDRALEATIFPSEDGILRLSIQALQTLRPVHLVSGLHEEFTADWLQSCGRPTIITGYTEWVDGGGSAATLGWDWEIRCATGQVRWHCVGLPFTNLLLVGGDLRDLPYQSGLECLAAYVDTLAWEASTWEALRLRYAGLPQQI